MQAAAGREVTAAEVNRVISVLQRRQTPKAEWLTLARKTGEEMRLRDRVKAVYEEALERKLTPEELRGTIRDLEVMDVPRESWPTFSSQIARRMAVHLALRTIFKQFRSASASGYAEVYDLLETFAGLAGPGYRAALEVIGIEKEEDPWEKPRSERVPPDTSLWVFGAPKAEIAEAKAEKDYRNVSPILGGR